jgi:hypothetical protein
VAWVGFCAAVFACLTLDLQTHVVIFYFYGSSLAKLHHFPMQAAPSLKFHTRKKERDLAIMRWG